MLINNSGMEIHKKVDEDEDEDEEPKKVTRIELIILGKTER